jgi:hypothetical protein
MKQFIYTMAFMALTITAKTQNTSIVTPGIQAEQVKATLVNHNLEVMWVKNSTAEANYWEVQGSRDGKNYSTIGVVLGADPKGNGSNYHFKQTGNKIRPGYKYYRVLHIENEERAVASNSTRLSK